MIYESLDSLLAGIMKELFSQVPRTRLNFKLCCLIQAINYGTFFWIYTQVCFFSTLWKLLMHTQVQPELIFTSFAPSNHRKTGIKSIKTSDEMHALRFFFFLFCCFVFEAIEVTSGQILHVKLHSNPPEGLC